MRENVNKKTLVKKYKDGTISAEELILLKNYFRSESIPDDMSGFFKDLWDSSSFSNEEFDVASAWEHIAGTTGSSHEQSQSPGRKSFRMSVILRYAAVFILAFGLAWLISKFSHNQDTVAENPHFCRVEVSYGSKSSIELPDGTHVSLNSGSFIRYPAAFSGSSRDVYFEGEAYFEVKKGKLPFVVTTGDVNIRVLGTTFNVKAYPEEKEIETTLIAGKVEVDYTNPSGTGIKTIVLKPNQKVVIPKIQLENKAAPNEKATKPGQKVQPYKAYVENVARPGLYTSWKDNMLEFDNIRFDNLMTKFERWYNVTIINTCPELNNVRLSGVFEKETIEQAFNALNLTVAFDYTMDKNVVTIRKKE